MKGSVSFDGNISVNDMWDCLKNNHMYFLIAILCFKLLSGKSFHFVALVKLLALLSGEIKETISVVGPG
jgi:hypothetical protein